MNSITGQAEINGTSLIDITDPAKPTTKWHIPGISRANHRHVGVVYDYKHDSSGRDRSEEHTSELQSQSNLVCRLLLEKKKRANNTNGHGSIELETASMFNMR